MAGPAIRSWEFAKALSKNHRVVLVTPNESDLQGEGFTLISTHHPDFNKHFKETDILIAQQLRIPLAMKAKRYGIKIIIDAYDPIPLETLEQYKHQTATVRHLIQNSRNNTLIFGFQMADAILCASEKQRDLWLGFLLSQKLLTPHRYDQNNSLRQFIDVVPFGLPTTPPQKNGPGLRELYGLDSQDKILLWGGGIWNWFDPLSLIKAMKIISQTRQDVKLVFMGIKNPDPNIPEMAMCAESIRLAKDLDLYNQTVYFNDGWIPYSERQNYLLDATIGVSTHFDHLETRYSFRTRMLDYIWAQLPIIGTMGDSFAELIQNHQLGCVVPYQDENCIAESIVSLIDDPHRMESIKLNLYQMHSQFNWEEATKPLEPMIASLMQQPAHAMKMKDVCTIMSFVAKKIKEKGLRRILRA